MLPFGKPGADPVGYAKVLEEHMTGEDRRRDPDGNKDYLFTWEWTRIQTVEEAMTFVKKIWNLTTVAERKYIYAVYRGRSTAAAAVDVIRERIREAQAHVDDLERTREEELKGYRESLSDDVVESTALQDTITQAGALLGMLLEQLQVEMNKIEVEPTTPVPINVPSIMVGGNDAKLRKLIAFMDAVHDFTEGFKKVEKSCIADALGMGPADVPTDFEGKSFIHKVRKFIKWLDGTRTLYFGGEAVPHTLHGRHLLHHFDIHKSMKPRVWDYWSAYREQCGDKVSEDAIHADVWCLPQNVEVQGKKNEKDEPTNNKAVVYLSQIANVVASMKKQFGRKRTFIVDKSEHQLSRMMIATSKLDAAIDRLFIVRKGQVLDDEGNLLVDESRLEIGDDVLPDNEWHFKVCDANLIDGNLHLRDPYFFDETIPNPIVDAEATGTIAGVNNEPDISLKIRDATDYWDVDVDIGGRITTVSRKKKAIEKDFKAEAVQLFTADHMKTEIQTMRRMDPHADISVPLAMKRVCDWGQVQHCKVHDCVFVSADQLPCLYALYENVDVIYMSETDNTDKLWPDNYKVVHQKTFALLRKLTDTETQEKLRPSQEGGSNTIFPLVCACLAAVTLACAFFGSS
jgi:hypothetical protein